jgi:hypothetical protein
LLYSQNNKLEKSQNNIILQRAQINGENERKLICPTPEEMLKAKFFIREEESKSADHQHIKQHPHTRQHKERVEET